TTKVLHRGELRHLGADFADDCQGRHRPDAFDLGQVDADHVVQRGADVETRVVRLATSRARAGFQRWQGAILLHPRQLLRDLRIAVVPLLQVKLPRLVRLPQGEEVFLAIRAGQGLRDFGFAGPALRVPVLGQLGRVADTAQDRLEDVLPSAAGDVADDLS